MDLFLTKPVTFKNVSKILDKWSEGNLREPWMLSCIQYISTFWHKVIVSIPRWRLAYVVPQFLLPISIFIFLYLIFLYHMARSIQRSRGKNSFYIRRGMNDTHFVFIIYISNFDYDFDFDLVLPSMTVYYCYCVRPLFARHNNYSRMSMYDWLVKRDSEVALRTFHTKVC
jgi:hypothetical protein